MKEVIKLIAEITNISHDLLMDFSDAMGWQLTDKELHLWVMGIMGIIVFFVVQVVFKALAKWSITSISFIYSFTVLVVIVFAIEIQQKITGRGNMEFLDAVIGLWGFLLFFGAYLIIRLLIYGVKKLVRYMKENRNNHNDQTTRFKG
ncbi:hypothetical protein [Litchfieldia salsa]|uniref:Uncharacterized protein n=1 Tax=Litchfieldia salsa TaxID=930152 RepID=A0A1H0WW92_9BACI|nr:hypothetical protein [Litchfieldia salsa]SDP94859.1 hypothetical protein SAMN05216565_11721 [Litchfieldia salsa]